MASELDDLLSDLATAGSGRDATETVSKQPADELDDLMSSLDVTATAQAKVGDTATEIDSLMESLGGVADIPPPINSEPPPPIAPTSTAPTGVDDLDGLIQGEVKVGPRTTPAEAPNALGDVLADFESEMEAVEDRTGVKRCGGCGKEITGAMLQALNQSWHQSCFKCAACSKNLATGTFYESGTKPHCEECYQELFCPRCAGCGKPVKDSVTTAMNKQWHAACFVCTECKQPFPGGAFYEKDEMPYCQNCHSSLFAARCARCGQAIIGEIINAMNMTWHREHFTCAECDQPFQSGAFYEVNGKPYCEAHYTQASQVCARCNESIRGPAAVALGKRYHPEHFQCTDCDAVLDPTCFNETGGLVYCDNCMKNHSAL